MRVQELAGNFSHATLTGSIEPPRPKIAIGVGNLISPFPKCERCRQVAAVRVAISKRPDVVCRAAVRNTLTGREEGLARNSEQAEISNPEYLHLREHRLQNIDTPYGPAQSLCPVLKGGVNFGSDRGIHSFLRPYGPFLLDLHAFQIG